MDNKVYSAFFRELQPYNFSQIKEKLDIEDDEQLKKLIRTMKAYNILKTVSSEKLDYENRPEQSREAHFAKEEKRLRYETLREKFLRAYAERLVRGWPGPPDPPTNHPKQQKGLGIAFAVSRPFDQGKIAEKEGSSQF